MGRLTEDTTHLVMEIHAERADRARLMRDVKQTTAEMKRAVGRMLGGFQSAHVEATRRQRRMLRGFVSGLRSTVGSMRREFAADLAGARHAWAGASAAARTTSRRGGMWSATDGA